MSDAPVDAWLPVFRELGALALVAVVLLYLIREYLPGLTEKYLDQLRLARETFNTTLAQQRADFVRELSDQRRLFEDYNRAKTQAADRRHAEVLAELKAIHRTAKDEISK